MNLSSCGRRLTGWRFNGKLARTMKASTLPAKSRPAVSVRHPSFVIGHSSVPTVDQVMVEERAAAFTKRSIKAGAKLAGLKMAVSMCDLTTLEG